MAHNDDAYDTERRNHKCLAMGRGWETIRSFKAHWERSFEEDIMIVLKPVYLYVGKSFATAVGPIPTSNNSTSRNMLC